MLLELIPENAQKGKELRANVLEKLDMVRPSAHQGMHAVFLLRVWPVQLPCAHDGSTANDSMSVGDVGGQATERSIAHADGN